MTDTTRESATLMFAEAGEAHACVARQASESAPAIAEIGAALRELAPRLIATVARGSSDHAATYAKYLIETAAGAPVVSWAPSVSSIYSAPSALDRAARLAISQSGRSPDIVSAARGARGGGGLLVALVNDAASPLAGLADHVAPLHAFPERSVAATKSYLCSLAMIARIVAAWTRDEGLLAALGTLPGQMARAWELDWSAADEKLAGARNLFVIGRGIGLCVAQEAALKFKETCRIHAEAYSAAEVLHGPAAIVRPGFPVLAFAQDDASAANVVETAEKLAAMGAEVIVAGAEARGCLTLPVLAGDPRLQPILLAQSFYRLVNRRAVALGQNPDAPPHLNKVTETT